MANASITRAPSYRDIEYQYAHDVSYRSLRISFVGYLAFLLCALPFLRLATGFRFRPNDGSKSRKRTPVAPCRIPFWDHMMALAKGGHSLFSLFLPYTSQTQPIHFPLLGKSLYLLPSNPTSLRKTLYKPHIFTDQTLRARFIVNVFGVPALAASLLRNDDSGSGLRPFIGSKVAPNKRIMRAQQLSTMDFLNSKEGVKTFLEQFGRCFEELMEPMQIHNSWTRFPDFYTFLRTLSSGASINAMCGPALLQQCPKFTENFWVLDANIHYLHLGMPKFFNRAAYESREVCLEAIIQWRRNAIVKTKRKGGGEEERWDEHWGLKAMKDRNTMYDQYEEFADERARAGADLGILWASNDNLIPAACWFVHTLISRPSLLARATSEINSARLPLSPEDISIFPRFDTELLIKQPLLLSIFHEVLRTQVTSFLARTVEEDYMLDDYLIPKGSYTITSPWLENHNLGRWSARPGGEEHPTTEFWPERFLIDFHDGKGPIFSLKGVEGAFLPFGIGHHICPGKHFATRAILNMAAMLVTVFEFEPADVDAWAEKRMDASSFGYTPFKPVKELPFRVRRKGCNQQ